MTLFGRVTPLKRGRLLSRDARRDGLRDALPVTLSRNDSGRAAAGKRSDEEVKRL